MPIIMGVPRSGTTLLRFMLDAHPSLTIPAETGFLAWASKIPPSKFWRSLWTSDRLAREAVFRLVTRLPFKTGPWPDFGVRADEFREELRQIEPFDAAEGFRAFYRVYARKQNKLRYGDKTPLYCRHLRAIEQILPEAHFIHVIRDGRDVALSLRPMWFAPARDLPTLAQYWSKMVRDTREAGRCAQAYREVRYEELVRDPATVLKKLCEFLKLEFDPAMLRYWEHSADRLREHQARPGVRGRELVTRDQRLFQQRFIMQPPQASRVLRWKLEMTADERAQFAHHAGEMLRELGYEADLHDPAIDTSRLSCLLSPHFESCE